MIDGWRGQIERRDGHESWVIDHEFSNRWFMPLMIHVPMIIRRAQKQAEDDIQRRSTVRLWSLRVLVVFLGPGTFEGWGERASGSPRPEAHL
jgi:hypothetical protein